MGTAATVQREFPWVRAIGAPQGTSIPKLREMAFEAAAAPAVAVIEDHVVVPKGWARQLLGAVGRGEQVVGGAVENAATQRLVDWAAFLCEYHHLLPPLPSGPVKGLPGNNTVYARDLLARYRDVIREGRWEDRHHAVMQGDGVVLMSRPEIVVGHKMHYTNGLYTRQRYLYSRSYAGSRVRGSTFDVRALMDPGALAL